MHVGTLYRTVLRRDWETFQGYPNLWPYRCELNFWVPSSAQLDDVLGLLLDTQSSIGKVTDVGSSMQYVFRWEFGFDFVQCEWTIDYSGDADRYVHRWVFTSFDLAGFLLVTARGYGLTPNANYWNFDGVFVPGSWTSTATGDWDDLFTSSNLLVRCTYVDWPSLPPDDQP